MKPVEWVYNTMIHAGLPAAVAGAYFAFQGRNPNQQTYRKFSLPSESYFDDPCRLWIHGASVGEATVVNKVLDLAVPLGVSPDEIIVSTQTQSGRETVDHDRSFLLPADYPSLVGPLSDRINAECLAVVETEIWPNLYRYHSGRTLLLNARLSDAAYRTYRWIRPLIRATLDHTAGIYARSDRDRDRFREFTPDHETLGTTGDLKWTRALNPPESEAHIPWNEEANVLVAGSTHPGEEAMVLDAVDGGSYRVVLAPRHLDRIDAVRSLLAGRNLDWVNYSELPAQGADPDVLLVDEFGLLEGLYRSADIALVGGSWRTTGGHNLLEAAQYGVSVITGPNHENFREMAQFLKDLELLQVVTEEELGPTLRSDHSPGGTAESVERLREAIRPIEERYEQILDEALIGSGSKDCSTSA